MSGVIDESNKYMKGEFCTRFSIDQKWLLRCDIWIWSECSIRFMLIQLMG